MNGFDPDGSVREYWGKRLQSIESEKYRCWPCFKLPEDLWVYRRLIEQAHPAVIVELGTHHGGSALWFADQLSALCGKGDVITVDLRERDVPTDDRITYVVGDLADMSDMVKEIVDGRRAMVVEDAAHRYEVTLAALRLYEPLVPKGSYFVVEDTIVDTEFALPAWDLHFRHSGAFGGVIFNLTPALLLSIEGQGINKKGVFGSLEYQF